MPEFVYLGLLWSGAIGSGLMAGIYFAFSAFVMQSLSVIAPEAGMAAMQSINRVIVRSPFLLLFLATTVIAAVSAVIAAVRWESPESVTLLAAGLLYIVGMFGCTVALNIPLNDELAARDPATASGQQVWSRYVDAWTRRNHIRTAASTIACGLFIATLVSR